MAEITNKLKKRFCKDYGVPIKIYDEPYFSERLQLFDELYDSVNKYNMFIKETENFATDSEYLDYCSEIETRVIEHIKNTEGYKRFMKEDFNDFSVKTDIPRSDIYKSTNDNREFLSIDIVKANFSVLKVYCPDIFNGADTWEEFLSNFTDDQHILNSKQTRQVIMGNCSSKRQTTYEKYLMYQVLISLSEYNDNIVFFSNDEIVIDITDIENKDVCEENVRTIISNSVIDLRLERFTLHEIKGSNGFYKKYMDGSITLKCVEGDMLPFVIRKLKGEEITESDKVFKYNHRLCKYIDVPDITV